MELSIPLEEFMGLKLYFNFDGASCDWLNKGRNVESWKLVNVVQNDFAHFRELYQLSKLLG